MFLPTAARALVALAITVPLAAWSGLRFASARQLWPGAQLVGAIGLLTVAAAHAFEGLGVFPRMGWGRPSSAGHYIDLFGAIVGLVLFPVGFLLSRRHE